MTPEVPEVLTREMGCTRAELLRWWPGASGGAPIPAEGEDLVARVGAGTVRVSAVERPPRRIALVVLPVLLVTFRFEGLDAAARRAFLDRFDLYTRRGGG